ncbi:hypothetical protein [Mycolicibacterium psychrotolerans]|uniref:hypothetical protein n=1 Tax=Mycolicibacterium psychrotolerans TaxID=216929 RepID=UPI001FE3FAE8|nr:hypothetical protein [Mycolicibacterium psychrotolerans]
MTVMLFGLSVRCSRRYQQSPRSPPTSVLSICLQQALLKIVFGPLVAVIGQAVLGSGVLTVAVPTTWPATFLSAVVFGAGQQAVTRYVDQRAGKILDVGTDGASVN